MAETNEPTPNDQQQGEIAQLRQQIQQMQQQMNSIKDDAVREALDKFVLQAGNNATVSGGNGNYTVSANIPTSGTVTGNMVCNEDGSGATFNGTVTF